jgi:NCAIR mutase (PurE)-related protein
LDERTLAELLDRVAAGEVPVRRAVDDLRATRYERVGDVVADHHRELRTGQAEAVYAPGKTPEQVRAAASALATRASGAVFVTKATPEQYHAVLEAVPEATYRPRSRLVVVRRAEVTVALGSVAVVCAGTTDLPIADEAAEAADALGLTTRCEVIVGTGDDHGAAVGAGALAPGANCSEMWPTAFTRPPPRGMKSHWSASRQVTSSQRPSGDQRTAPKRPAPSNT